MPQPSRRQILQLASATIAVPVWAAIGCEQNFNALSQGDEIMMPLGEYPFSKKFAWITDRFGVSWQLATT